MAVLLAIIIAILNPNDLHCPLDYINLQQLRWYIVMFQNFRSSHKINPMLLHTLLLNRCIWLPYFFPPQHYTDKSFQGKGQAKKSSGWAFYSGKEALMSVLWRRLLLDFILLSLPLYLGLWPRFQTFPSRSRLLGNFLQPLVFSRVFNVTKKEPCWTIGSSLCDLRSVEVSGGKKQKTEVTP